MTVEVTVPPQDCLLLGLLFKREVNIPLPIIIRLIVRPCVLGFLAHQTASSSNAN